MSDIGLMNSVYLCHVTKKKNLFNCVVNKNPEILDPWIYLAVYI